jgi:L-ascorbate metabolism protein UlaG (beta-lactamase superfamily)
MDPMAGALVERPFEGSLADALAAGPGAETRFYWLGQAGFVIDIAGKRLVIDPYLSDSLAVKYRGTPFPHERMMAAPVTPEALSGVDAVLCTHAHTDHMDPGTLPGLFAANPGAELIAPRAVRDAALDRSGLPARRIHLVDAGEDLRLGGGLTITPTRAAHETLERDVAGNHRFLGYVLCAPGMTLWHAGDTIPFEGQVKEVQALAPDVALLPVNGRRPELGARGIAGNLNLAEAVALTRALRASAMVAHHHGLFAFNTADPETIDSMAQTVSDLAVVRARQAVAFEWVPL